MAKTLFVCSQCGNESPKWHGRCPGCGEWNSMVEERVAEAPRGAGGGGGLSRRSAKAARPMRLADVEERALGVPIVAETDLDTVAATLEAERPDACVVDSVQTLYASGMTGTPGSVGQVREVAGRLMRVAKERDVAVILVGHVTKEGALAGPRVLEHLVDCVLQFEGERERTYRTLR